ncbi:MAG: carboxypeptidase-like regulatory domain-containing protein [Nocardioides sp.]|nr:carboxypeptidase-like regulatory domain-containing protein [Nocardioides sp.]
MSAPVSHRVEVTGLVEVDGAPARYARVQVRHEDGVLLDVRADALGGFVAAGLPTGPVTVTAHDARRAWSGRPVRVDAQRHPVVVRLDTPTSALVVSVHHADGGVLPAADAAFVNVDTHQRYPATVRDGLCDVTGIAPGVYDLVVEPSFGSLGGGFEVGAVAGEQLGYADVVVARGATVTGRVVDSSSGQGQLAAVVTLFDSEGTELEHTRTDPAGRFLLGHGLPSGRELTVVVTSGPERHHVTRVAVADVTVEEGSRLDLGAVGLAPTCVAVWAPRLRAASVMKLPGARV